MDTTLATLTDIETVSPLITYIYQTSDEQLSTNSTSPSSDGRDFVFDNPTQRLILGILSLIVSVIGTFGNSITILAVVLSRKLRTITNVFVVNLAVADLLTCLILPWNVIPLFYPPSDEYPLPDTICKAAAAILYTCAGCSLYTLAVISINRYFLITRQSKVYRAFYSKRKMAAMVFVVWIFPFLVALVPPMCGLGELGYTAKYSSCTHDTSHPLSDYYSMLQAALLYPVPLTVIVVCYVRVFLHLKDHHRTMKDQVMAEQVSETASISQASISNVRQSCVYPPPAKKKQLSRRQIEITKNLFYVVVVFLICISPFGICLMIPISDPLIPWVAALFLFNSCLNWMIYATKHPHFKTVYRLMLTCKCAKIPEQSTFLRSFRSTFRLGNR